MMNTTTKKLWTIRIRVVAAVAVMVLEMRREKTLVATNTKVVQS